MGIGLHVRCLHPFGEDLMTAGRLVGRATRVTAAKLALCAAVLAMASCGSNDAGLLADDPLATSDTEDLD